MEQPTATARDTARLADLDGLISVATGEALADLAADVAPTLAIVEVGSYRGKSTCYLAEGARSGGGATVFAFDAWNLDGNAEGRHGFTTDETMRRFAEQVVTAGLADRIVGTRAFSLEAAATYDGPPIGLLFLDGSHLYDDVRADLEAWYRHVVPGGVIVFDDYRTPKNPGVTRYVDELAAQGRLVDWSFGPDGLAIARRRPRSTTFDYLGTFYTLEFPDPDDHIARRVYDGATFYEVDLLADALGRYGDRTGVAIDVGAHVGNHTTYFAGVMGLEVVAIEPQAALAAAIRRNADLNEVGDRVRVINAGAGPRPERARLRAGEAGNSGTVSLEPDPAGPIEVLALDELGLEAGLLKVDVEGGEAGVLDGALDLLTFSNPLVYVEARNRGARLQVGPFLEALGYREFGVFGKTPTYGYARP